MLSLRLALIFFSATLLAKPHSKGTLPIPTQAPSTTQGSQGKSAMELNGKAANTRTRPSSPTKRRGQKGRNALIPMSGDPCEHKHSIENFMQISSATSPQGAPNGGLYFISDLREVPQLWHLKAPKTWPEQLSFFSDGVVYYSTSPSGKKVLLASHHGGDEQYDIYLFEWASKKISPLLVDRQIRIDSVAWGAKEDWFAFTSNQRNRIDFDLYRYDLVTKKSELITELSGQNSVTDVSPDGRWIALNQFRSVTDTDVLLWNIAEKKLKRLRPAQKEMAVTHGKFSANSKSLLFASDDESGTTHLHHVRLAKLDFFQQLSSGPWGIDHFSVSSDRSQVAMLFNEDGYSRLEAFELAPGGERKNPILVPEFPESVTSSPSFKKGAKDTLFVSNSSSTHTSDIWELTGPTKIQWTYSTKGQIRSDCLARAELIHYPSFDGLEIPAFIFRPLDSFETGPIPFVIHIHGGPESQYRPSFNKIFQYFLERGFGVFAPNVRGSTGYGRDFTLLDNYKKRMDSVKDAEFAAKWLVDKGHSSKGLLAIYGGSYGGFLVLRTIQQAPEYFAAASESVGISDFVTFLKNTKPYRRALREAEYGPLSDEEFLKSISPMTYLDRIKTPLMIFHGANDPRVPVSETEQIVEALRKRDIPVDAKIFANEGHGNAKLSNIMEQAKLMAFFFDQQIQRSLKEKRKAP